MRGKGEQAILKYKALLKREDLHGPPIWKAFMRQVGVTKKKEEVKQE